MLARMMCAVSLLALAACTDNQTASNTGTNSPGTSTTTTGRNTTTAPSTGTTGSGTSTTAPSTTATPSTTGTSPSTSPGTTTATPGTGTTGTATGTTPPVTGAGGVTAPSLSALQGTTYSAGPVSLLLKPDNTFEMRSTQSNQLVSGQYTYTNGVMSLTSPRGDIGGATFPMQCRLQQTATGFQLTDAGGNCTYFRDLNFRR